MHIAVCDDDEMSRSFILKLLSEYTSAHQDISISFSAFSNSEDLLEAAEKMGEFDIYILDIVMPEMEEVEMDLDEKDIRVDIYHASGAGGQHVNKTASAVRLTHIPTGIAVAMQDERSQLKNRDKAMKVLRARVYDQISSEAQSEYDASRKSAVGTGDRSERIRTYNFPQNRVTDHRIGLTIQKLDQILAGKMDEVVDALILADQAEKLEKLNNGSY